MRHPLEKISAVLVFLIIICGCNPSKHPEEFDFTRILGRWASVDTVSAQAEEWRQQNDSLFTGAGYVLEAGDTTFFETLEIVRESGSWIYNARVGQGPEAEKVSFHLLRQNARLAEFVNENHDFPKKIGYELLNERELQSYIEGPRNGQTIRIIFNFMKVEK